MKFFLLLTYWLYAFANPFTIDFPEKQELTNEDYIEVQRQICQIDIYPLLRTLYPGSRSFTTFKDFAGRCSKGTRQILIDPENGLYPIKELVKIGRGGDKCIVCHASFNGKYPYYIQSLIQGLRDQKFNGYFFYRIGGWPTPTGKEIKYAAVPYSFKIFIMLEAYKLGFNNVLWIDSACYPLRNPDYLFATIAKEGALLNWFPTPSDAWRYIFPQTRELLYQLTGTNVLNSFYINTIVFGLKMSRPDVQELVRTYYECAELGTPFLSCFPEEWVLTAIIGKKKFAHFREERPRALVRGSPKNLDDSPEEVEKVRKRGAFFYHRKGR